MRRDSGTDTSEGFCHGDMDHGVFPIFTPPSTEAHASPFSEPGIP